MGMVGRGNDDCIDLFVHLLQHLAKVMILFGFRDFLERAAGLSFINIAHRHNISTHPRDCTYKPASATAYANKRDIKLFICFVTESCTAVFQNQQT